MKNVDFEEDRYRVAKSLELLEEVIGPAIHCKSLEKEAETIVRLIENRSDQMEITFALLGMVTALMDVVSITSGQFHRPCDYYHYVVKTHKEDLARYN
jgi:hypothetical protein